MAAFQGLSERTATSIAQHTGRHRNGGKFTKEEPFVYRGISGIAPRLKNKTC